MRARLLVLFVIAVLAGCSPQPPAKKPLPKDVAAMTVDEARELFKECVKNGSNLDPGIPYSAEDCSRLYDRINEDSLRNTYKPAPVGEPMLH